MVLIRAEGRDRFQENSWKGSEDSAENQRCSSGMCFDKHLIQLWPSEAPKLMTHNAGGSSGTGIVSMWTCERECILLEGKKQHFPGSLVRQSTSERDGYQGEMLGN